MKTMSEDEAAAFLRVPLGVFQKKVAPELPGGVREWYLEQDIETYITWKVNERKTSRVYFVKAEGQPLIKIGVTGSGVKQRMGQLQVGCPYVLELLGSFYGTHSHEGHLHIVFRDLRVRKGSEWFHEHEALLSLAREERTPGWLLRLEDPPAIRF